LSKISFTVPGEPVTWKRARRGRGHSFTDPRDAANRERIRAFARNAGIRKPLTGPVALTCLFYTSLGPLDARVGDADNYEKAVKDALQGIAFVNDRQVCDSAKRKRQDAERPRTYIEIEEISL